MTVSWWSSAPRLRRSFDRGRAVGGGGGSDHEILLAVELHQPAFLRGFGAPLRPRRSRGLVPPNVRLVPRRPGGQIPLPGQRAQVPPDASSSRSPDFVGGTDVGLLVVVGFFFGGGFVVSRFFFIGGGFVVSRFFFICRGFVVTRGFSVGGGFVVTGGFGADHVTPIWAVRGVWFQ